MSFQGLVSTRNVNGSLPTAPAKSLYFFINLLVQVNVADLAGFLTLGPPHSLSFTSADKANDQDIVESK